VNLLLIPGFYDIALRDFGLLLGDADPGPAGRRLRSARRRSAAQLTTAFALSGGSLGVVQVGMLGALETRGVTQSRHNHDVATSTFADASEGHAA
jgi:hypothetical protein